MNCDDFLPFLETGGPLRRMQAHRHAARCPRCGLAFSKFRAVREELARPHELSAYARQLWQRAARDSLAQPAWRYPWAPVVVALATAACVMIAVVQHGRREGGQRMDVTKNVASVKRAAGPIVVVEVDASAELSELGAAAERLDAELNALRKLAEKLDAEREMAMTLTQYRKW